MNYYRRFVKNFAQLAYPINRLLTKNVKFEWTEQCEEAFRKLKEKLTQAPILAAPCFEPNAGRFILDCDASAHSLGFVLSIYKLMEPSDQWPMGAKR